MNKLILGTSNADYHADKTHLSSSQLKLLLQSTETFYDEIICGLKTPSNSDAFEQGTLMHTLLLEPEKLQVDYAIYPGLRRGGNAFEDFKAANPGKTIITYPVLERCEKLVKAAITHKAAFKLLTGGLAEANMISQILSVPVKARADYINIEHGYIVDFKSTALPTGEDVFRETIKQYKYALSAALYAQIAYDTYGKLFDFYWIVISKNDGGCAVYKASSATLSQGAAEVTTAIVLYKKCKETNNWKAAETASDVFLNLDEVIEI